MFVSNNFVNMLALISTKIYIESYSCHSSIKLLLMEEANNSFSRILVLIDNTKLQKACLVAISHRFLFIFFSFPISSVNV